jgi:hypothetical protein
MRFLTLGAAVAVSIVAMNAYAQTPAAQTPAAAAPTPIAGTVTALNGAEVTVRGADEKTMVMTIGPNTTITTRQKSSFAAIKPNDFVASAAVKKEDGKIHAQEVRIFPESMRGLGEGHRPMLEPNQTMTNATVKKVAGKLPVERSMTNAKVSKIEGGVLTTEYPGGSTEIVVDPDTPVWAVQAADKTALTPGTTVRGFAEKGADGALTARYLAVQ